MSFCSRCPSKSVTEGHQVKIDPNLGQRSLFPDVGQREGVMLKVTRSCFPDLGHRRHEGEGQQRAGHVVELAVEPGKLLKHRLRAHARGSHWDSPRTVLQVLSSPFNWKLFCSGSGTVVPA